jgi:hypothetical protein
MIQPAAAFIMSESGIPACCIYFTLSFVTLCANYFFVLDWMYSIARAAFKI